jgi:hypothetical protein
MRSSWLAALAALSLGIGSSAASAQVGQPVQPTTASSVQRAGAQVADADELRGTTGWILGAIAVGLLIWGALELFGDDDEAFPVSP